MKIPNLSPLATIADVEKAKKETRRMLVKSNLESFREALKAEIDEARTLEDIKWILLEVVSDRFKESIRK